MKNWNHGKIHSNRALTWKCCRESEGYCLFNWWRYPPIRKKNIWQTLYSKKKFWNTIWDIPNFQNVEIIFPVGMGVFQCFILFLYTYVYSTYNLKYPDLVCLYVYLLRHCLLRFPPQKCPRVSGHARHHPIQYHPKTFWHVQSKGTRFFLQNK